MECGDESRWMLVMWDVVGREEVKGDEIRGRRRSCTSGQRRREQLVIAGEGTKPARAKPDLAESTCRTRQASQSIPSSSCRAPRLLKPAARPQQGDLAPFSPSSRPSPTTHPSRSYPFPVHQSNSPTFKTNPNTTQIHQNDWRQVWRQGLWHQVQRAIVSHSLPPLRSSPVHHFRVISGFKRTRLSLSISIGAN